MHDRQDPRALVTEFIGARAGALSLIELGLGSVLHAFNVPLGGHFLSVYQTYFLTAVAIDARKRSLGVDKRAPYLVSTISSVLKSLSPAGNRLGPMVSISMQGILFSAGGFILGANLAGHLLGAVLAGLWAFVQPFLTYLVFFGPDLVRAVAYFVEKSLPFRETWVWGAIAVVVALKLVFSAASVLAAYAWRDHPKLVEIEKRIRERGMKLAQGGGERGTARSGILRGVLRDLTRPLFLASLAITGAFFAYSQRDATKVWAYLLRPVAVAAIFFYLARSRALIRLAIRFEKTRLGPWAKSLRVAMEAISSRKSLREDETRS